MKEMTPEEQAALTAHELSALADQGMPLTDAQAETVRQARQQTAQPTIDIDRLIAEMREGLEGVTGGDWVSDQNPYHAKHPRISASDGTLVAEVGNSEIERQDQWLADAAHIARCKPTNIAALLTEITRPRDDIIEKTVQYAQRVEKYWAEITRLRAELKTVLDRETATTARLEAKIELVQWTTDVSKALIEAHFSLCYRYQDFLVDAPLIRDGRATWCAWHLHPSVRAQMTNADAALYDALMKTRGSTEQAK